MHAKSATRTKAPKEHAAELYAHGRAYYDQGDINKALNHYVYAIELYPDASYIYASLAYIYLEMGKAYKGLEVLTAAIERFPKQVDFIYHRSYFYTLMGQEQRALADLNLLIERDRNNIEGRWQRAHHYIKIGNYEAALADFLVLDKYDPDPSKISTFFLAQTYSELGHYHEAAQKLKEYVKANEKKHNRWHPIGKAYFYLARNLRLAGNSKEAAKYYGLAIEVKLWPDVTSSQRVEAQKYSDRYLSLNQNSR